MIKIDDPIEFIMKVIKNGFIDSMVDFNKKIANIGSNSNELDIRQKYENYKISKASNVNEDLDESLEQSVESNYNKEDTLIKRDICDNESFLNIDFAEEDLMKAIVYTEILGKPKAKRRRR